ELRITEDEASLYDSVSGKTLQSAQTNTSCVASVSRFSGQRFPLPGASALVEGLKFEGYCKTDQETALKEGITTIKETQFDEESVSRTVFFRKAGWTGSAWVWTRVSTQAVFPRSMRVEITDQGSLWRTEEFDYFDSYLASGNLLGLPGAHLVKDGGGALVSWE